MDRQRLAALHAKASEARQAQLATASSSAKVYEPKGLEGTSLGQTPSVTPGFNVAAQGHQPTQTTTPQGVGSQMVAKDAPRHNLNPPDHVRAGPDRIAHNQQLSADQRRALAANEQIKARRAQAENAKMKNGPERDLD